MAKLELLNNFPEPLTDKFELDPGVPGGRGVVVHPAPVLATVPHLHNTIYIVSAVLSSHLCSILYLDRVQVEGGLAAVWRLLVEHVASLSWNYQIY